MRIENITQVNINLVNPGNLGTVNLGKSYDYRHSSYDFSHDYLLGPLGLTSKVTILAIFPIFFH